MTGAVLAVMPSANEMGVASKWVESHFAGKSNQGEASPGLPIGPHRRLMAQWKQVSRYFLGDYYPLTPYSQDARAWIAWQFDKPETGEGMIIYKKN